MAPDTGHARGKKWTLTREALDRFLLCLDADRHLAGEKYLLIRRKLVKFFEWRGAGFPEDQADETINRVVRKVEEGEEIRDLQSYCKGVARLVLIEELRRLEKERASLEVFAHEEPLTEEADDTPQLRTECFRGCLQNLSREERELIIEYYEEEKRAKIEGRKELAARLNLPLNALRIRAHRIRSRLEACVRACLGADEAS